jgi:hypothetical protein
MFQKRTSPDENKVPTENNDQHKRGNVLGKNISSFTLEEDKSGLCQMGTTFD